MMFERSGVLVRWARVLAVSSFAMAAGAGGLAFGAEAETKAETKGKLVLNVCSRVADAEALGGFRMVERREAWDPAKTAVTICDMWDAHWCKGATRRVGQMAPRMNEVVKRARELGALIIHAPSATVGHYKDHPARKHAQEAPAAATKPEGIEKWCSWMDEHEREVYPIDQSDGGCDCDPKCPGGGPWKKQIETIEIEDVDAITDSGVEVWNLIEARGIENVIVMGVHTNMCVLGRPFGLRQMTRNGKNVVLMRDLTDTMYNHRMKPFVNHFAGTDLIVEHIEKYVCPTVTSADLLGYPAYHFPGDERPHVVLAIGEDHYYDAPRVLRELAVELESHHEMRCTVLQVTSRTELPGLEALREADLAVFYMRRRMLPKASMRIVREYLAAGKPLMAFRTTSHAFAHNEDSVKETHEAWHSFDRDVLGCRYGGYTLGETQAWVAPGAEKHPILKGLEGPYVAHETLYRSAPLAESATPLLMGRCVDGREGDAARYRKPKQYVPDQPLAWVNDCGGAKVFYVSMGSGKAAFRQGWYRRMVLNAVYWLLEKEVPEFSGENGAYAE